MPEKFECMRSHSGLFLPECLVINVISRLPAKSVARFRCVSTTWLSISTDPSFILDHTRRSPKTLVFPFIPANLVHKNKLFSSSICFDKRGLGPITDIPLSSCDGLVCFQGFQIRGASEYYVMNPLTGLSIDLPTPSPSIYGENNWGWGLYFHQWTGQYRLLNVRNGRPLDAEVLSLGGAMNWRKITVPALDQPWFLWETCVQVNDCMYWICEDRRTILVFDILEEAFSCMACPRDVVNCRTNFGLVDIEGKLGCWMASSKNAIDSFVINIWVAVEGRENWRSTYSLNLADEWRRLIYPSPYALMPFIFFNKGELLCLVRASNTLHLLRWDIKSGNHSTKQLYNQSNMSLDRMLIHKETFIDMSTITQLASQQN